MDIEAPYEDLLEHVFKHGVKKTDRTGTGTLSVFGPQMTFPLWKYFPLIQSKKVFTKGVEAELLWMLRGETNIGPLVKQGVHIWDEWADKETGELGPVYGAQWRSWKGPNGESIDQITNVIQEIVRNPDSRRLVVSAWNVAELPYMALTPCHALFQFYVSEGRLSCKLTQRSADLFLGVPFNIASYALLTHMVAQQCGLGVGDFIWSGGDVHIYVNHLEQVEEQLSRERRPHPQLILANPTEELEEPLEAWDGIFKYERRHFEYKGNNPHAGIKAPVAV